MAGPKKPRAKATGMADATPRPYAGLRAWHAVALLLASLVLAIEVYSPAANGPFLLDDGYQLFGRPDAASMALDLWLNNVRPLLNLSFYVNYQMSGTSTSSYHLVNVLLHWLNAVLCFFILRRLLRAVRVGEPNLTSDLAPLAGAALFLLHPVQTESVAYVSSRSELLSVLPAYAALLVFLGRPAEGIGWPRAAAVVALFGAAVLTKEHTAALPAVFLLADAFFHPEGPVRGIRSNWRLYAPMIAAAALGLRFVLKTLRNTDSAGFGIREFTWYEYFFTQWRMFWSYLRLAVLPVGLNADPDVAISRTVFDHGAIVGGIAIAALIAAAFVVRRRYPLAAFGVLAFLVLLAPTSSFVPIRDVFAERRLYLPMIGLLCVAMEGLRRLDLGSKPVPAAMCAALALCAYGSWQRAHVWSGATALWEDTVAKSPNKYRPRFQYAFALYSEQRCTEAAQQYEKAASLEPPNERLYVDWALALDCSGRADQAEQKLVLAAKEHPSGVVYANLAMIYGKTGRNEQALAALDEAEKRTPRFAQIYAFRGNVFFAQNKVREAAGQYQRALQLDPANQAAIHGMRAIAGR